MAAYVQGAPPLAGPGDRAGQAGPAEHGHCADPEENPDTDDTRPRLVARHIFITTPTATISHYFHVEEIVRVALFWQGAGRHRSGRRGLRRLLRTRARPGRSARANSPGGCPPRQRRSPATSSDWSRADTSGRFRTRRIVGRTASRSPTRAGTPTPRQAGTSCPPWPPSRPPSGHDGPRQSPRGGHARSDQAAAVAAHHPQPAVAVALERDLGRALVVDTGVLPSCSRSTRWWLLSQPSRVSGTVRGSGPRLCTATMRPSSHAHSCASTWRAAGPAPRTSPQPSSGDSR